MHQKERLRKKEESAGALNAYIYLIMDAQLNIQNGAYVSVVYLITEMFMKESHTLHCS